MATEPIRDLSPNELAEKRAEERLLAGQILREQPEEPGGLKEFKPRLPSAFEGGGKPLGGIPAATKEAVERASEGVSPDAARALGLPRDPKERLNVLLQKLQGDCGDPQDLVEMLMGGNSAENQ